MDPRHAKLQTLQDLIGAMDEHMLGPARAKAQTKATPAPAPAASPAPAAEAPAAADDDKLDADTASKLRKLYEEDELAFSEPTPTT